MTVRLPCRLRAEEKKEEGSCFTLIQERQDGCLFLWFQMKQTGLMSLQPVAKQGIDQFAHRDVQGLLGRQRRDRSFEFRGKIAPGGDVPPGGFRCEG